MVGDLLPWQLAFFAARDRHRFVIVQKATRTLRPGFTPMHTIASTTSKPFR
jgi:hypothetical protein